MPEREEKESDGKYEEVDGKWVKGKGAGRYLQVAGVDHPLHVVYDTKDPNGIGKKILRYLSRKVPHHFLLFRLGADEARIIDVGTATSDSLFEKDRDAKEILE